MGKKNVGVGDVKRRNEAKAAVVDERRRIENITNGVVKGGTIRLPIVIRQIVTLRQKMIVATKGEGITTVSADIMTAGNVIEITIQGTGRRRGIIEIGIKAVGTIRNAETKIEMIMKRGVTRSKI